jgi:hypothetical protein
MPNIKLIPVDYEEVKDLMKLAFKDDQLLLEKLTPVQNDDLESCVERCYASIVDMFTGTVYAESIKQAYKVEMEDSGNITTIGFSVTAKTEGSPNELFSFGINIHYRSKKIIVKWLDEVKKLLGKYYWVALYKQNERAITLFERNGFTKIEDESRHFVTLCQNYKEIIKQKQKAPCL